MKKIGVLVREKTLDDVKDNLSGSQGCFFIGFSKIAGVPMSGMRNSLRKAGSRMLVAKNTIISKAFGELGMEDPQTFLDAETGIVLVRDGDLVAACKVLVDFSKDNDAFRIKGGYLNTKKISAGDVTALAKLPSREVLLGMVVSTFAAPISGLVNCLNAVMSGFVTVLDEVRKKKDKS